MSADPSFHHISQDWFLDAIARLVDALGRDSGWRPDWIVGIGRGGLVPAVYLSHATAIPLLSIDHSSAIPAFDSELVEKLAARSRDGDRLLFVDDINDSGRTIASLREQLAANSAPADGFRFAVLIDNATSRASVDYSAHGIDRTLVLDWFVFPWEAVSSSLRLADEARQHGETSR